MAKHIVQGDREHQQQQHEHRSGKAHTNRNGTAAPAPQDGQRFVSPAVSRLAPSGIRKFFDLAASHPGVISLGVGEPDFPAPEAAIRAGQRAIASGRIRYTANAGLAELREAVARSLRRRLGLSYDPEEEILITVGASEALDLALRAVVRPGAGDRVIIPQPAFVSYEPLAALAGGVPVPVELRASEGWRLTPGQLEAAVESSMRSGGSARVLMLCYPNNPTGAVMNAEELEAAAEVARRHDLLVISDEIYEAFTYEGRHASIAARPDMQERTVLIGGFSKAFAMTGWRVGYAAGPAAVLGAMRKIHQYAVMSAPTIGQMASLAALLAEEEEEEAGRGGGNPPVRSSVWSVVETCRRRRDRVMAALEEAGLDCAVPRGAFYAFPSVASTGLSGEEFAERLLVEAGVAVVPGSAFGKGGHDHVRLCYAVDDDLLEEALRRIRLFVRNLGRAAGPAA